MQNNDKKTVNSTSNNNVQPQRVIIRTNTNIQIPAVKTANGLFAVKVFKKKWFKSDPSVA